MFKRLAIDVLLAIFFLSVLSSTQLSAQGPAQREACRTSNRGRSVEGHVCHQGW